MRMETVVMLLFVIPFAAAAVCAVLGKVHGKARDWFAVVSVAAVAVLSLVLFDALRRSGIPINVELLELSGEWSVGAYCDWLSVALVMLVSLLGLAAALYSMGYMKPPGLARYYGWFLFFVGSMNAAVLMDDLFTMFVFWELMTVCAFFLVIHDKKESSIRAGVKYFLMSEMGAVLMLVGIIIIHSSVGTTRIPALIEMSGQGAGVLAGLTAILPLLFLVGAGVKAGVVPLHTWLPDAHPAAPSPISSLLSGVMIKIGIYVMIRVLWQMMGCAPPWDVILCGLGSMTIVIGVMMALVQHDAKRLLAYHSVSQVGYIILGIGTGVAVGVAGGLFHLINHAVFKGLLFLCVGAVIYRTRTRELSEHGGLARAMPITFATCLVAALSISGVPPFNGFYSKWMVYEGVVAFGKQGHPSWVLWMGCALFGSALTLASFMKLIYAMFLAPPPGGRRRIREVPASMWLPMAALALVCVIFGVFAKAFPLSFIERAVPGVGHMGVWQSTLATGLIIVGVIIGAIIYLIGRSNFGRVDSSYVGGEDSVPEERVTGVDFYQTIRDFAPFAVAYGLAERKFFDIYEWSKRIAGYFSMLLRAAHSGYLPTYITWVLVGLFVFLLLVVRVVGVNA